jgi:ferredoxin-type protein NapF
MSTAAISAQVVRFLVSSSPLVCLSTLLSRRGVGLATGLGLAVTLVVLFRRRWFCRWVCPPGTCMDAASLLGRRCGRSRPRFPSIGNVVALLTLAGAAAGYPLLIWLDPLALFSNCFTAPWTAGWFAGTCCVLAVPLLALASFVWPGIWCMRLCPLGATQDLLVQSVRNIQGLVSGGKRTSRSQAARRGRRMAILGTAGAAWAWCLRSRSTSARQRLRPPGSAKENQFAGLCLRCGNCIRACPAGVIVPDLGRGGPGSFLSPELLFRRDYCREDCVRCTEVCPSGAIERVASAAKAHAPIGVARVDMDICLLSDERECSACRNRCPFDAIRIPFSKETYSLTVEVVDDRCPGCGACEVACPTKPAKAIIVIPRAGRSASATA